MATTQLPEEVVAWLAEVGGGRVTRTERHVARREAWVVDIERSNGSVLEGFLRFEREPLDGDPWSLGKESSIVAALAETSVPVPKVLARSERPSLTLFERVPGRADLGAVEPDQQRTIMEAFIGTVVDLHLLDPDALDLGDLPRPTTAQECALGEVDLIVERWQSFLAGYHDPLITFGLRWLRCHVPDAPTRISLLQGDTGPVNFLFEGDHLTALVDWEWGHLGDPMEDLGNICVREILEPLRRARRAVRPLRTTLGHPVPTGRRPVLPSPAEHAGHDPDPRRHHPPHPREPLAWYLAYRYVGDRSTCEALAEAIGLVVEAPVLPDDDDGEDDVLLAAARWALTHDVAPGLDQRFAQSRLVDVDLLLASADRRQRHGKALATCELDELADLLGRRPASLGEGLTQLSQLIEAEQLPDEEVLTYLTHRALRDEWLWAPVVSLYPDRRWSALDRRHDAAGGS